MAALVDANACQLQDVGRRLRGLCPTQEGLDALEQHLYTERLGDIIVGADGETNDLVGLLGLACQHQDRDVGRLGRSAQLAADIQTVQSRQHQVQDQQSRKQRLSLAQSLPSLSSNDDLVPLPLQVVRQNLRQRGLIFDD